MSKTIHEIHPDARKLRGKARIRYCKTCEQDTLQYTPFYGYPFICSAEHGSTTRCHSCDTYVSEVAKVVVDAEGNHKTFCELCAGPDTPEKHQKIEGRRRQAEEEAKQPVSFSDPVSIARAFGASSFKERGAD